MLGAIDFLSGDYMRFVGSALGVFPFLVLVLVFAMLGAEEVATRFFRSFSDKPNAPH